MHKVRNMRRIELKVSRPATLPDCLSTASIMLTNFVRRIGRPKISGASPMALRHKRASGTTPTVGTSSAGSTVRASCSASPTKSSPALISVGTRSEKPGLAPFTDRLPFEMSRFAVPFAGLPMLARPMCLWRKHNTATARTSLEQVA